MWVVMVPQRFDAMRLEQAGPLRVPLEVGVTPTAEEPHEYLPLFDTYDAAVRWNGGEQNILEVRVSHKLAAGTVQER